MEELNARLNELLPVALFYDKSTNNPDEITNKIRKFYFGDINKLITIENIKPFMDVSKKLKIIKNYRIEMLVVVLF